MTEQNSLDKFRSKEVEERFQELISGIVNEEFENMTGEQMPKIFPQSEAGQSMRWSKFKDDDPRRIFEVMSQRVFPAIKSMKYGRLPDFNEKGELIEIEDEPEGLMRTPLHLPGT